MARVRRTQETDTQESPRPAKRAKRASDVSKAKTSTKPKEKSPSPAHAENVEVLGNPRATMLYRKRWLSGKPSKEAQRQSIEERLRAGFFVHKGKLPRCYSCRKSNARMPEPSQQPDGTEKEDLLPCGHEYKESMLELFLARRGMFAGIPKKDRNEKRAEPLAVPLTLGKHRGHFMAMFEIFFGKFSIEKMLNIGNARVEGCKEAAVAEGYRGGPLGKAFQRLFLVSPS
ncbi:hypothetical protein VTN49DRAFT_1867 [Thermomyces lanuginosus]|uniref:uncharacterized protein n=1 Tax=Thermomyces lanuginosus TaxID=5541 RepID=UPI003743707C